MRHHRQGRARGAAHTSGVVPQCITRHLIRQPGVGPRKPLRQLPGVVVERQDLLVVARVDGRHVMVPFVGALVPAVDVAGGRLVVDLPDGLLDLTVD